MQIKTVFFSRSNSPLNSLKKFFRAHDDWLVFEEVDFSKISYISAQELWIDSCIDLYRLGFDNMPYFYRFFSELHYFLESVRKQFKTVRLLRYFAYDTDFNLLKKNFSLYRTFTDYFQEVYDVYPLYLPDILEYTNNPTNIFQHIVVGLASQSRVVIPWKKSSTFSVISVNDVFSNLTEYDLIQGPVTLGGLNVCLGEVVQSAVIVWGGEVFFEEAYTISKCNTSQTQELNNIIYNLEDMLINMLK